MFFVFQGFVFYLAGDILIWHDYIPSCALRDILDWNFKLHYFFDHEKYLSSQIGEDKFALLTDFIVKVSNPTPNRLGIIWRLKNKDCPL